MLLLLLACRPAAVVPPSDREAGVRAPLSATCSSLDALRCALPWPSSSYTTLDSSSETGVRVALHPDALPVDDDPSWLNLADGFSRVSPLAVGFTGVLDPATAADAVHLYVSFEAGEEVTVEVPVWTEVVVREEQESLLLAYPRRVLPANADLVAVVSDGLRRIDGSVPERSDAQAVVLGLQEPEGEEELALRAYHAPTRALLQRAGLEPEHLLRAWDFSTRSADDPGRRLLEMQAAMAAAQATVQIRSVVPHPSANVAMIVEGTLEGLPDFLDAETGWLQVDAGGHPQPVGSRSHPFRIVVPKGEGDYRIAMYGHGTGGDVHDSTFDDTIAGGGFAKVGIEFQGWTGKELIDMIIAMKAWMDGSSRSTSALLQSLAGGYAIFLALNGPLGDTLAAEEIGGQPNPAAGRRPDLQDPTWVGGSLGGTMGAIEVASWPELYMGVLNVPGGAWSHIIPQAELYNQAVRPLLTAWYPSELDARLAIAMGQNAWDDVDGAVWEDPDAVVLLQESMGDPVQPNLGTAMFARATEATVVGVPLDDMLLDLPQAESLEGQTGITQFRTSDTDMYGIHGFAATSSEAGMAAMEQIRIYMESTSGGNPRIEVPSACVERGSCDFAN
ncbi:MAG TPA: hypothetical protein PKY30_02560 [Myxococcota bacterium]|nr:hypothetical protein [Myxococcota bacterium]